MKLTFLGLLMVLALHGQTAVICRGPWSLEQVVGMLRGSMTPARVKTHVQQCGVSFELSSGVEQQLRQAGATDPLVDAVREKGKESGGTKLWSEIKDRKDASAFTDFLSRYPQNEHAGLARARLTEITNEDTQRTREKREAEHRAEEEQQAQQRQAEQHGIEAARARRLNEVQIEFVPISAGEFRMGCSVRDHGCYTREKPTHQVRITRPFEIGKYEVTQAQWEAVMGSNPSRFRGPDRPVEQVSWKDVQLFFERLNSRNDSYQYRLPTQAEWEYAARAGTRGMYPISGSLDEIAWFKYNSGEQTHPVGQKRPNDWGLYDMLGNVWEWCSDWWEDSYGKAAETDPSGPTSGTERVVRGGGWEEDMIGIRVSYRGGFDPNVGYVCAGFRCVRERR